MTKIVNIPPDQTPQVGRSHKTASPPQASFQKALDQAFAQNEAVLPSKSPPPESTLAVDEIKSLGMNELSQLQAKGMAHAERIVELLAQFESCLATQTLKEAVPLVKALEEEAQAIDPVRESLAANPQDKTYGIIEEAWGRAVGVSINFHRGDYIPIA